MQQLESIVEENRRMRKRKLEKRLELMKRLRAMRLIRILGLERRWKSEERLELKGKLKFEKPVKIPPHYSVLIGILHLDGNIHPLFKHILFGGGVLTEVVQAQSIDKKIAFLALLDEKKNELVPGSYYSEEEIDKEIANGGL